MALSTLHRPAPVRSPDGASALRRSIREGGLILHYQPKVDLRSHQIVAVEALVRLQGPDGSLISPDNFIPQVEDAGLMPELTAVVLSQALDQYLRWRDAGLHINVAVNVAASLLSDTWAVPHVSQALVTRSISPAALTLEVTESVVMTDPEAALHTLRSLAQMGVGLSIDDFGTGFSSLSYLSRLPVHELKIDRSFVTTLASDENHQAIVRSTLGLGHGFGHRVVAEGVEDLATYLMLTRAGCDLIQGYFVSRPLPEERFSEWLQGWPGRALELKHAVAGELPLPSTTDAADDDWVLARAQLDAYQEIVSADSSTDLAAALTTFVLAVGGRIGDWDDADGGDLLPIDVSLGIGGPLLPVAAPGSRARRCLDGTLPRMVEHVHRVASLLRTRDQPPGARL